MIPLQVESIFVLKPFINLFTIYTDVYNNLILCKVYIVNYWVYKRNAEKRECALHEKRLNASSQ